MITLVSSLVLLAVACLLGWKMDRIAAAQETMADRWYHAGEEARNQANELAALGRKVDHVAEHFVYPPITDPIPLPSMDEETAAEPKRKRTRKR